MSTLIAVALLAGLIWTYWWLVLPLRQVREALSRLAEGDFRTVLFSRGIGPFAETGRQVQKISEMLQQLDRQLIDEGFSLKAILSSMVEGVLITDRTQRIKLANEPLLTMFGLKESPIDRSVMEVFFIPELRKSIEGALEDGEPRRLEIVLRGPSGNPKHLEVHAGGLNPRAHARPLGAVVVFHDVTAIKALEAVRREFVANVSHEFRTPLSIINGYTETLLDGALDDRATAEKFLVAMQRNGHRLALLIDDLLTISTMEQGSGQLEIEEISLPETCKRVIERLGLQHGESGQVLLQWNPPGILIPADPRRIEQVFANLIENAFRHGHSKGVEVRVSGRIDQGDAEIVVSDNGPGIPYEAQAHVFERFYRVRKDRARSAGGTGLGLSIVAHIIMAHGGTVSLRSVPGSGASFIIRLPGAKASSASFGV